MESIIIEDNATLMIENSLVNITQESDFQFSISVRDGGKLVMNDGVITSNKRLNVYLNDSGVLEISNDSILNSTTLRVNGAGAVFILNDSLLDVPTIDFGKANKITFMGLKNAKKISGYHIDECGSLLTVDNCEIDNLTVDSSKDVTIDNTVIGGDTWFYESRGDFEIRNSTIENLNVQCCRRLRGYDSVFENLAIIQCTGSGDRDGLEFYNSTLKDIVTDLMPRVFISNCIVTPTKKGFSDNLCSAEIFVAEETDFVFSPLFTGTTRARLYNISVASIDVRENAQLDLFNWNAKTKTSPIFDTPDLNVHDSGKINLYRTLECTVLDSKDAPVKGAVVDVMEDIGNVALYTRETDRDGGAEFLVLTSIIEEDEEDFRGYYRVDVRFTVGKNTYTETNTTTMVDKLDVTVRLDIAVKGKSSGDKGSTVWIWSFFLVFLILVLIAFMVYRSKRR